MVIIIFNNRFLRERGMASNPLFIIPYFFYIFQTNFAMATGQNFFPTFPKDFSHFLQNYGSYSWVILENAKRKLVFHFGVGRYASFPQKPVVKLLHHKNAIKSYQIGLLCWKLIFIFSICLLADHFDFHMYGTG